MNCLKIKDCLCWNEIEDKTCGKSLTNKVKIKLLSAEKDMQPNILEKKKKKKLLPLYKEFFNEYTPSWDTENISSSSILIFFSIPLIIMLLWNNVYCTFPLPTYHIFSIIRSFILTKEYCSEDSTEHLKTTLGVEVLKEKWLNMSDAERAI